MQQNFAYIVWIFLDDKPSTLVTEPLDVFSVVSFYLIKSSLIR